MSSPPPNSPPTRAPVEPAWKEFARSPLVPVALAVSLGLIADRFGPVALPVSLFIAAGSLLGWFAASQRAQRVSAGWLWVAAAALAAVHHHNHRYEFAPDDIGHIAKDHTALVKLRCILDEEPVHFPHNAEPLLTIPSPPTTVTVLKVTAINTPEGWVKASGRVRATLEADVAGLHCGDRVEVVGLLSRPRMPHNPGEFDSRSHLLDRRITAELRCRRSADTITRIESGWRHSFFGWMASIRGWGTRTLRESIPSRNSAVAAALLLGDGTAMDREEWDAYLRTGVIHVLVISGQHLAVLAGFIWLVMRIVGLRRRDAAWIVAIAMIGYTVLTGANSSAVRATVMVSVFCGGIVLRRRVIPANAFALAWIVVVILNPTDPFTVGCQLSFLSVFVLVWGAGRWLAKRELTPVEQLIDESRTPIEKLSRACLRGIGVAFAISMILGIANAPLILARQNIVSPIGIVLGPPLIVFTSVALIAGFLLLIVAPLGIWLAWPFAQVVKFSLGLCAWLIRHAEEIPGAWLYAPSPASWWLIGFYAGVAGVVLFPGRSRRIVLIGLAAWVLGGLALGTESPEPDELRVAFLSVGNGGCAVIEAPDGRVLLYDVGTMSGPDVVRRVIAPYLWSRGIRRIDEVFISHADLDHYNGVPALLNRFPIGQITFTPSFRAKPIPGVTETLTAIERHRVSMRVAKSGDRFDAGAVSIVVLHPPEHGPSGNENARSLVMLIRHRGHTILLTGDLDGSGQDDISQQPLPPIDIMQVPHHGAFSANKPRLNDRKQSGPGIMADWARPRFAVSSQGTEPGRHLEESYGAVGAEVWDTGRYGTITLHSHSNGLVAESYRLGEVKVIKRGR